MIHFSYSLYFSGNSVNSIDLISGISNNISVNNNRASYRIRIYSLTYLICPIKSTVFGARRNQSIHNSVVIIVSAEIRPFRFNGFINFVILFRFDKAPFNCNFSAVLAFCYNVFFFAIFDNKSFIFISCYFKDSCFSDIAVFSKNIIIAVAFAEPVFSVLISPDTLSRHGFINCKHRSFRSNNKCCFHRRRFKNADFIFGGSFGSFFVLNENLHYLGFYRSVEFNFSCSGFCYIFSVDFYAVANLFFSESFFIFIGCKRKFKNFCSHGNRNAVFFYVRTESCAFILLNKSCGHPVTFRRNIFNGKISFEFNRIILILVYPVDFFFKTDCYRVFYRVFIHKESVEFCALCISGG